MTIGKILLRPAPPVIKISLLSQFLVNINIGLIFIAKVLTKFVIGWYYFVVSW
jgi:hypothetical protein